MGARLPFLRRAMDLGRAATLRTAGAAETRRSEAVGFPAVWRGAPRSHTALTLNNRSGWMAWGLPTAHIDCHWGETERAGWWPTMQQRMGECGDSRGGADSDP